MVAGPHPGRAFHRDGAKGNESSTEFTARVVRAWAIGEMSNLEASGRPAVSGIESYIHGELRKLYPDAEFPSFECRVTGSGRLEMVYRSRRGLADLAEGLILGCASHFGETVELQREDLPARDGQAVRFSLVSRAPQR